MNDSVLIVLTNSHGIDALYRDGSWKPLSLRRDQEDAKTICFINVDSFMCEAVALLDEINPFRPWGEYTPSIANLRMPQISEVLDFVEPFMCIDHGTITALVNIESAFPGPALHYEAFTIFASQDFLYGPEDPATVGQAIVDEFIINRRTPNVVKGLKFLHGKGGDQLARVLEYTAPDPELVHEPLFELPSNWQAVVDEDDRDALLWTLNSLLCDSTTFVG